MRWIPLIVLGGVALTGCGDAPQPVKSVEEAEKLQAQGQQQADDDERRMHKESNTPAKGGKKK